MVAIIGPYAEIVDDELSKDTKNPGPEQTGADDV